MTQDLRRSRLLLAVLLLVVPTSLFAQCGVERWSVKTGTDADVGLVHLTSSSNTTIAAMRAPAAPSPIPANNRVAPLETTQWIINATLTLYKLESDSDYHLVLQDANGLTMIGEIPSPTCVGSGSPFLSGITNARNEFNARFTATTSFQTANIPVKVTGVGMFDFLHGQTGVAPNGIELHPILDIVFNPGSSSGFCSQCLTHKFDRHAGQLRRQHNFYFRFKRIQFVRCAFNLGASQWRDCELQPGIDCRPGQRQLNS